MRGIKTLSRPFRFHQENVPTSPNPQFCQIGRHNYTQNWPISFWSQDIKRISQMFPSRTWENNIWLKWRNISLRNSENVSERILSVGSTSICIGSTQRWLSTALRIHLKKKKKHDFTGSFCGWYIQCSAVSLQLDKWPSRFEEYDRDHNLLINLLLHCQQRSLFR